MTAEIVENPAEIMQCNYLSNRVQDSQLIVTVTLTLRGGDTRERRMESFSMLDERGNQLRMARYSYPPQEAGVGTLAIERDDGNDDIWAYLPALARLRRIASTNRSDSFMGSDFTYEDIITPRVYDYDHLLERTEPCDEHVCHVIRSTPRDRIKHLTAYGAYLRWIRTDNCMTVRAEMTNKKGAPFKMLTADDLVEVDAERKRWLAQTIEIKNLERETSSRLRLSNIKVNIGIPKDRFTTRALER